MGLSWLVIFALFAAWSVFRNHRPGFLMLWSVMLGIFLANTTIGHLGASTVTTVMSGIGHAVVLSLNAVSR